jgi:hypothetical protein
VLGPAVPRPEGPLPGLVVTRTLMSSPNLEYPCRLQEVECFVYPGSGQVVVTGASVRRALVELAGPYCGTMLT